ncbi:hypothetical protein [Streptomyces sp. NBC_00385]|uniref:hypothetical protein n=1 Tax=Streptomyces sp. NBC_00385 TaxID=2975733 RepID=UPI002DDC5EE0|nr:hypothetical protein [Streptomyces sp. NBC_00385]WRZ05088.1 hypothetical protein OG959_17875 [Streptomyces sp. NBC_00385]
MALLTPDQIGAADDRRWEDVDVPEWGGTVRVASMSGTDRNAYQKQMLILGSNGRPQGVDLADQYARLLAKCLVDEDFRRLYVTDKQVKGLGAKNGAVLERLATIAKRVSGLGEEAVDDAAGKSEPTPSGSSTSD